jgi:uncharacterized protein (TIGR00369 family)
MSNPVQLDVNDNQEMSGRPALKFASVNRPRYPLHMSGFDPRSLIDFMCLNGHNAALGIKYVDHGADWCELRLPYDARLTSSSETGIMASGPIITLMDVVSSLSLWFKAKQFQPQATLDLRVDYLRPAAPGKDVFGRGECYALTKSIGFVRGVAHDGDPTRLVAHVAGTFMLTAAS